MRILIGLLLLLQFSAQGQYEILMYDGDVVKTNRVLDGKQGVSFEQISKDKKRRANFDSTDVYAIFKDGKVLKTYYQPVDLEVELSHDEMRSFVYGRRDGRDQGPRKARVISGLALGFASGFAYPSTFNVLMTPSTAIGVAALWPIRIKGEEKPKPYYALGYKQRKRNARMTGTLWSTFAGTLTGMIVRTLIAK